MASGTSRLSNGSTAASNASTHRLDARRVRGGSHRRLQNRPAVSTLQPEPHVAGVVTGVLSYAAFVDVGVRKDGMLHAAEARWLVGHSVGDLRELIRVGETLPLLYVLRVSPDNDKFTLTARRPAAPPALPHSIDDRCAERRFPTGRRFSQARPSTGEEPRSAVTCGPLVDMDTAVAAKAAKADRAQPLRRSKTEARPTEAFPALGGGVAVGQVAQVAQTEEKATAEGKTAAGARQLAERSAEPSSTPSDVPTVAAVLRGVEQPPAAPPPPPKVIAMKAIHSKVLLLYEMPWKCE